MGAHDSVTEMTAGIKKALIAAGLEVEEVDRQLHQLGASASLHAVTKLAQSEKLTRQMTADQVDQFIKANAHDPEIMMTVVQAFQETAKGYLETLLKSLSPKKREEIQNSISQITTP